MRHTGLGRAWGGGNGPRGKAEGSTAGALRRGLSYAGTDGTDSTSSKARTGVDNRARAGGGALPCRIFKKVAREGERQEGP